MSKKIPRSTQFWVLPETIASESFLSLKEFSLLMYTIGLCDVLENEARSDVRVNSLCSLMGVV